jgi:hypothetical protein
MTRKRRVYDCKNYRRQSNIEIAEAARHLIDLVREQIDTRGRVSSSLIARIAIDDRFVSVSFVDVPDDFMDITEWRRR